MKERNRVLELFIQDRLRVLGMTNMQGARKLKITPEHFRRCVRGCVPIIPTRRRAWASLLGVTIEDFNAVLSKQGQYQNGDLREVLGVLSQLDKPVYWEEVSFIVMLQRELPRTITLELAKSLLEHRRP